MNKITDNHKEIIDTIIIIVLIIILLVIPSPFNNNKEYYRSATVISTKEDVCYLEDTQGNVWSVEDSNLRKYGRYILVMNNNGTEDITDDTIVSIE